MKLKPKDIDKLDDPHAFMVALQRRSFGGFVLGAYPQLHMGDDLKPNWHLDAIEHQLDRVRSGLNRRLLVTLPPRNLKSFMISVAWVAWCLGHQPNMAFVCVSYSNELSGKLARDCRALMQTSWYRELFPRTIISAARSAAYDFETTAGGGRFATSVGGSLTGRGGDVIIIDDPINPLEAKSDLQRNAVNDWFSSTLASRLNDKTTGAIITVMQRLHQFDLAGKLIESGDWFELSLPAIATRDENIPLTRDRVQRRKEGDILHPRHEPLYALEEIKKSLGSHYFEAQYQQNPIPAEGNIVKAGWIQRYAAFDPATPGRIVQSWDTASEEGALNDYSVCITAHIDRATVRILDVYRHKLEFPALKQQVIRLARQFKTTALLIEQAASGRQLIQTLRNEQPAGMPLPIARKPEGDKVSRLMGAVGKIESGQLLLPTEAPWLAQFEQELLAFPNGRHDDQVDALTQLMNYVMQGAGDFTDISYHGIEIYSSPFELGLY